MPIKICFVTREYAHPKMGKTGGIGVFVKQFTQALKTQGFQITVFTFGKGAIDFNDQEVRIHRIKDLSEFNDRIKAPFIKYKVPGYITLKKILEYCNRWFVSLKLSFFLAKQKFHIVEFHDYGGDAPFVWTKIPKVVRCHGTAVTLNEFMGYPLRSQDAVYERKFFKRIHTKVVAVSQFSARITQKAFELKDMPKIIYNGVQLPAIEERTSYLEVPTMPYSIWYFGSVRERKGIDIACKVFNNVLELFPNATFHVMGYNNNDHWNNVCIKLLNEEALSKTTYYGNISNDQVNPYLQQAHIVLFPSYGENFSIALLEVMALGKVVLTSSIPSFEEIIKPAENGLMAKTEKEFIEQINWAFMNPEKLQKIGLKARQTIEMYFDFNVLIHENIDYYKSLL